MKYVKLIENSSLKGLEIKINNFINESEDILCGIEYVPKSNIYSVFLIMEKEQNNESFKKQIYNCT